MRHFVIWEVLIRMSVFAIADLHLSTGTETNKSMEVFGDRWRGYVEKIRRNWEAVVRTEDTVVIPGDISWGMRLEEALPDLQFLQSLPGQKFIGKGNHDFWWTTATKMKSFFVSHGLDRLHILYNNAHLVEGQILCGTRGWFLDEAHQRTVGSPEYTRVMQREVIRLRMSLDAARELCRAEVEAGRPSPPIRVFLHFPPVWMDMVCREFIDVLHEYDVQDCLFGHIHGAYRAPGSFVFEGIRMTLCASDHLNFTLLPLAPVEIGT